VITATGSLTGRTALDPHLYHEMTLTNVRTLTGAAPHKGWLSSAQGPTGPLPGPDAGALWSPDGGLFAIVWPAGATGTTVDPVLRVAPLTADEVIFGSAGCWPTKDLPSHPYKGPLAEVPGSNSYARATPNGFHAVPLTTIEQLLNPAH
jgi:hypothetical protein